MAKSRSEKGQAIPILVLALGLLLLGGLGLAIDGGQLYFHSQMAQVAADAAATAGAMSMYQGTNTSPTTGFSTAAAGFTCTTNDTKLPCQYARMNGFGATASDAVTVDFPTCTGTPDPCGYESTLSPDDSPNQIRVTITRNVNNSFIRMIGGALATPVVATSVAAIVTVQAPTPILITDPTNQGTLSGNGNTAITICGGPARSVQVNSINSQAYTGGSVVLTHAGTADPGTCTTGTGADFGIYGGDYPNPGSVSLGTTGHYIHASWIDDPYRNVPAPSVPAAAPAVISGVKSTDSPNYGCLSTCDVYSPGLYTDTPGNTLVIKNGNNILFKPGLYYIQSNNKGFNLKNVSGGGVNNSVMCVGCPADSDTGTGMVIYDSGPAGSTLGHNPAGGFTIDTNVSASFTGANTTMTNAAGLTVPGPPYYGLAFWEDRTADAQSHTLGKGNGCFSVVGTIYLTNTRATMLADSTHVQQASYNGNPCSTTSVQGDIIVGQLHLVGTSDLTMNLVPYGFLNIRQVALVSGGPHP